MQNEVDIKDLSNSELLNSLEYYGCVNAFHDLWDSVMSELKKRMKSKEGHWIKMPLTETGQKYSHECSLCGRRILTVNVGLSEFPYCHCGAKMTNSVEEE